MSKQEQTQAILDNLRTGLPEIKGALIATADGLAIAHSYADNMDHPRDDDGRVRPVVTVDLPADARSALDAEAERLTGWLDGVVITNVYKSQQMKQARLP